MGASAGSPPTAGGTSSGGMTTGKGGIASGTAGEPVVAPIAGRGDGGDEGTGGEPECPVTPVVGKWVGVRPDPYGFELTSDGSHLSGQGCLGGLPADNALFCSPLVFQRDHGRNVEFVWDMTKAKDASGLAYLVKADLTLSPERTAMAGKVWTSLQPDEQDLVLVRAPGQDVPAANECSGGEPTGDCFNRPLRSDRVDDLRVTELGAGSLLLSWLNGRGDGQRFASATFDAATGTWSAAEFLDDGTTPVDSPKVGANATGYAMVAYRQGDLIVTRAYDPKRNVWSTQRVAMNGNSLTHPKPEKLLVYDGGDATLVASYQASDLSTALSALDYVAKDEAWGEPHVIVVSDDVAIPSWAAASNSKRDEVVTWVRGGAIAEPFELWFSSRTAGGAWTARAKLHSVNTQIVEPAVAVDENANAIVTWHEWITRLASSSYSFATGAWSEPLTITPEPNVDNGAVEFNAAGHAVAYFLDRAGIEVPQRTELVNGAWSEPVVIPSVNGAAYTADENGDALTVTAVSANRTAPPALTRQSCTGY